MEDLNIHMIYLSIIFFILSKSFIYHKEKEKNKEHDYPTFEYYEWRRLYYKMLVLYYIKNKQKNNNHHIDVKHKWRNKMFNKSAYF
jgi:hypothetical protein